MNENEALAANVLALADVLRRLFESIREQHEVAGVHYFVLAVLARRGATKMADLTAILDMTKGNLTYHVDRMEGAGLVRRIPDPADRRITRLELTPDGHALYERVLGELRARLARLAAGIPADELATIQAGLGLLLARTELLELR